MLGDLRVAGCRPTWTADLGSFVTAVTAADGHVFALTSGAKLTSLDAAGGTVEWRATLPAHGVSVAVADGLLYAPGGSSVQAFHLEGCGLATCAPNWATDLRAAASANLVVASGVLYAGAEDATVTCSSRAASRPRRPRCSAPRSDRTA